MDIHTKECPSNVVMETKQEQTQLPENAFRELHEGEQYEPLMRADKVYPEVNVWSVAWWLSVKEAWART